MSDPTPATAAPCWSSHSRRWALASVAAFLVHDLEEVVGAEKMNALVAGLAARLPDTAARQVARLRASRGEMAGSAGVLAVMEIAAIEWGRHRRRGELAFEVMVAARILNGGQHVLQAAALRRYVPGVATAPVIDILVGALLLRLLRANCAAPVPLRQIFLVGAAIVPLAAGTARRIARSFGGERRDASGLTAR